MATAGTGSPTTPIAGSNPSNATGRKRSASFDCINKRIDRFNAQIVITVVQNKSAITEARRELAESFEGAVERGRIADQNSWINKFKKEFSLKHIIIIAAIALICLFFTKSLFLTLGTVAVSGLLVHVSNEYNAIKKAPPKP